MVRRRRTGPPIHAIVVGLPVFLPPLLSTRSAPAFECADVQLPSSKVICSDPELMRLTDERQEAINEARARIGEEAWPALWEDQKAWVRSYAAACGVPPDRPPPIPVPASIKGCFKRSAEARIAYIRVRFFRRSLARTAERNNTQPHSARTWASATPLYAVRRCGLGLLEHEDA
jgi:hypothetical protein